MLHEIFLTAPDKSLPITVLFTNNWLKAVKYNEIFKLPVQHGFFLLEKTLDDYLFHIGTQDFLREAAKIPKCIQNLGLSMEECAWHS